MTPKLTSIAENVITVSFARILKTLPDTILPASVIEDTPGRAARALLEMTAGYAVDVPALLKTFDDGGEGYNQMVLVTGIEFTSLCEHHLLPFYGEAHVAYLPKNKVYGLSKLARVVDAYAKRLQVQERLTKQIAEAVAGPMTDGRPVTTNGAACVIRAKHMCMGCRGVVKPDAETVTSHLIGEFYDGPVRAEFLSLIKGV